MASPPTKSNTASTTIPTKHPIELLDNYQKDLLQSIIKEKLKKLNHDDDVLLEYTMVLLSNKKAQTVMKDDLKPFLGSCTEELVDWIWRKIDDIKDGKVSSESRESDLREKVVTHERDRDHREKEHDNEERDIVEKKLRATKSDSPKEDFRNDKEISPRKEDKVDVKKRSRTENENDASVNKKAKVYMTPEAKSKLEISQEGESEGVTFTVTIGEDKSTIEDLKETTEKPNKKARASIPSKAYFTKTKPTYTRAPRGVNGRFKNMSLVLPPEIAKDTKISQPTEQSDSQKSIESQKSSESQKPSDQKVPIPPKKITSKFSKTEIHRNFCTS